MCVKWTWVFAIEVIMVYMDVASESCEVSLAFIMLCIRALSDLKPASFLMFMFPFFGLGFGISSCGDVGFGLPVN
jgi:hypothetical protein